MKRKKEIKPKRVFEELAELGVLDELLDSKWRRFYEQNEKFREEVNEILFNTAKKNVTVLERYILEELCKILEYFLDYTKLWRNPKQ